MSTPAIIYLVLTMLGLGVAIEKNGQPRTGKHSFVTTLIVTAITCGLLYWGGFFAKVAA